jgi:hypothetical protein
MAALFCNTREMELDAFTPSVRELKANIAAVLVQSGVSNVSNNDAEVAGNRANMRLSVLHLPIRDRRFYEQVMAAGDNFDATQKLVNEIVANISS